MPPRRSPPQWPWVDQLNGYTFLALRVPLISGAHNARDLVGRGGKHDDVGDPPRITGRGVVGVTEQLRGLRQDLLLLEGAFERPDEVVAHVVSSRGVSTGGRPRRLLSRPPALAQFPGLLRFSTVMAEALRVGSELRAARKAGEDGAGDTTVSSATPREPTGRV